MSTRNRWTTLSLALLALVGSRSSRDSGEWSGSGDGFRPMALDRSRSDPTHWGGKAPLAYAACTGQPKACDSGDGLRAPPTSPYGRVLSIPSRLGKRGGRLVPSLPEINDLATARTEPRVKPPRDDPDVQRIRVMVETAAQGP